MYINICQLIWVDIMARRGPKTEQGFRYWHLVRRGMTQASIAREHGVSRQAVSKAVQSAEREVVFRLLDTAQMSGVLVEWYDARRGVLIGLTPQLGNLACILVIDVANRPRMFFDQRRNDDIESARRTMGEMRNVLDEGFGLVIDPSMAFVEVIEMIIGASDEGGDES